MEGPDGSEIGSFKLYDVWSLTVWDAHRLITISGKKQEGNHDHDSQVSILPWLAISRN